MTAQLISGLALFAFVSSITPGPNNLMLLASGVNFGFRRSIPHMLGISIGFALMVAAIGLGIGALFAAVPVFHTILKAASVAYILWLAWRIATAGPVEKGGKGASGRPMTFWEAVAFQWVNPKAWAMALTGVSTFTVPDAYATSLALVTLLFGLINLPCVSSWTLFGMALRRILSDPAKVRIFNGVMAALLVASLVPLVGIG